MSRGNPAWASWWSTPIRNAAAPDLASSSERALGLYNLWQDHVSGNSTPHPAPDQTIDMIFEKVPGGPSGINHWLVNGKEYPHEREFVFRQGGRYRLVFHNRSDDSHPLHIHRHSFELRRAQRQADWRHQRRIRWSFPRLDEPQWI